MPNHRGGKTLPTRKEIVEFARTSGDRVNFRDVARAFGLRGKSLNELRPMLRELENEGVLQSRRGHRPVNADRLPPVTVLEVTGLDEDGELLARPTNWPEDAPEPTIYVKHDKRGPTPAISDRILARLTEVGPQSYEARIMRLLGKQQDRVFGVFAKERSGGLIHSAARRRQSQFFVPSGQEGGARAGDFVRAEMQPGRRFGVPQASVVEVLGNVDDPGSTSLIAIHDHEIPTEFTSDALEEAALAAPVDLTGRVDLRDLPLVTIDDESARDFDDAVWAEPDGSTNDGEGWHIVVAIADVAWYVRPDGALDTCARERGNSVYFPDRVVPMLPEELSNGLCSLKPDEDRPCIAAHMWIDAEGKMRRHKFVRGLMRSAARLTYREVQAAWDGKPDGQTRKLIQPVLEPLMGAYASLRKAREARGALDLDLPERRIVFDEEGRLSDIETRERFDSHKLIEEFMICANVAAAETLERRSWPCVYRVHDEPPADKLQSLRDQLDGLGYRLAKGQVIRARHFNTLLRRAEDTAHAEAVSMAVLRSQAQAEYHPENIGHFGLSLRRYAHFTSPIRRYADLLVHRALIGALAAGDGGLAPRAGAEFARVAKHVSTTERRAAAAERDTMDRLAAAILAERIGAEFDARISGVSTAGLFVALDGLGADGLVPMSSLGQERFHVEQGFSLRGTSSGMMFTIGDRVSVRLEDADWLSGRMSFTLLDAPAKATPRTAKGRRQDRRNGPRTRRQGRR